MFRFSRPILFKLRCQPTDGSNPIAGDDYAVVHVNAGTAVDGSFNAFNIAWDFSGEEASYSPAIAVFRDATLSENGAGEADRYIKNFVFESEVNVVTRNSTVSGTNAGDSSAMLGLSVVNKRSWMTFEQDTFLISDFTFEDNKAVLFFLSLYQLLCLQIL